MKHYGDITGLKGGRLPPVDIITGGSPCQDLSVAGRREGLAGERSGLFMEQIRIIKEMREATNGRCPRFMVWENVHGAFSSNRGEDFRRVLEEAAKIADEAAVVPGPPKGKWAHAGCIMGDGWSIAWRVHDAQFWGVPQRRRRIALVADFAGLSAPEILFERESLPWDTAEGGKAGKGIAAGAEGGTRDTGWAKTYCLQGNGIDRADTAGCNGRGWNDEGVSYTLNTIDRPAVFCPNAGGNRQSIFIAADDITSKFSRDGVSFTVRERDYKAPLAVYDARGNGDGEVAPTITGDHQNRVTDYTAICVGNGQLNQISMAEQANTLDAMHDQQAVMIAAVDCRNGIENRDVNGTLLAKSTGGIGVNFNNVCRVGSIVRRLTPLECERLQGFPDGWTDIGDWTDSKGKKHKGDADSPRYKALGNSIALPFWQWMAERMVKYVPGEATMGSLFDGIGGFPLAFGRAGCRPVWASEIDDFCIAVTKLKLTT